MCSCTALKISKTKIELIQIFLGYFSRADDMMFCIFTVNDIDLTCETRRMYLHNIWRFSHGDHQLLELGVDVVEPLGVDRQLLPDVLGTHEDGLEMGPGSLDVKPQANDLKCVFYAIQLYIKKYFLKTTMNFLRS